MFPSWGRGAHVTVCLCGGGTLRLAASLSRYVGWRTSTWRARGGYRVTPLSRPAGSVVGLVPTRPQSSAPTPGPTVAVTLGDGAARPVAVAARLTPRS
jgi:hypothetical protein